jgi:hypothetical protein
MCPIDASSPVNRRRTSSGEPEFLGAFAKKHTGKKCRDEHKALSGGEEPQWLVGKAAKRTGGMTRRGFCPDCGAPVVVKPDAVPQ